METMENILHSVISNTLHKKQHTVQLILFTIQFYRYYQKIFRTINTIVLKYTPKTILNTE